jgi:hypothetical protein
MESTPMEIIMVMPKTNTNNKVPFNGYITVHEELTGDFQFTIETNRCSFDLKSCEKYATINFRQICSKFESENAFFKGFFSSIKPPLKCPLKPGNYSLTDSIVDLSIISLIPIDGFIWMATFTLVSSEDGAKKKKIVMCINSETKILKVVKRT